MTGVQTCALPISRVRVELGLGKSRSYSNPVLGSIAESPTDLIPLEPDCDHLLLIICNQCNSQWSLEWSDSSTSTKEIKSYLRLEAALVLSVVNMNLCKYMCVHVQLCV